MGRLPINFRAFIIVAASVACCSLCAYAYVCVRALGIVLGCVLIVSLGVLTAIFAVKFARKTVKLRVLITFSLSLLLCVCAISFAAGTCASYDNSAALAGRVTVSGRVCAVDLRTGTYRIVLDDLSIDGRDASGKLRITVAPSDRNIAEVVDYGYILTFDTNITAANLIENGKINGSAYRTNIRYYATIDSDDVSISFGKASVLQTVHDYIRKLYVANMGDKYGNIAYAMLTGDKYGLYSEVTDYYTAAGLGHTMAVSGLHIGFMTMLLCFVLARVSKKIRFPIVGMVHILYAVFADFSPSVLRAVIMAVIAMSAEFVGGRRDLLSSLLCAFSVILAFRPYYLFEAGFVLSFGAIFGIAMFANSIKRFLVRHGTHAKVAGSIGSAVSVQAGIVPAQVYFFNEFQPLSAVINIALLPYVGAVFIVTVCLTPIAAIPHLGILLSVCKYLLVPLDYISRGLSAIPYLSITVYPSAAVMICYPIMFCASEFFMVSKGKAAIVIYSAVYCAVFCLVGLPQIDNAVIVPNCSCTDSVVFIEGKAFVVGYLHDDYALNNALAGGRCKRVDGIILFNVDAQSTDTIIELSDNFEIGAVYYDNFDLAAQPAIDYGITYKQFDENGYFERAYSGGELIGYEYNGILFALDGVDERAFTVYDVVRCKTASIPSASTVYLCNYGNEYVKKYLYTLDDGAYRYAL